jgi:nucleotide-binding universal stress UspA family protein
MGADQYPDATIVVGLDGSPSSLAALDWAARQADLTGSSLLVIAAWHLPRMYGVGVADYYDPAADMQRVLDHSLPVVRGRHPGLRVTGEAVEGYAGHALVDASRGASLLVVGSRGHGPLANVLLGSVGVHCATHAHCSVLVHRSDG